MAAKYAVYERLESSKYDACTLVIFDRRVAASISAAARIAHSYGLESPRLRLLGERNGVVGRQPGAKQPRHVAMHLNIWSIFYSLVTGRFTMRLVRDVPREEAWSKIE